LDAGLALLAADGFLALTVDRVCAEVGRSKGSFYHHFGGVDGYVVALLDHWRESHTEEVVRRVERETDPWVRRRALMDQAFTLSHAVERAMRVWGAADPRARAAIGAVDERRIAYLAGIIAAVAPEGRARLASDFARLEYAALVGLHQLHPDGDPRWLAALFTRLTDLVTPPGSSPLGVKDDPPC
jgi:AcrR family transcriptional regulator